MTDLKFSAILNVARTMIDGGWRVTFDIPENESAKVAVLTQLRDRILTLTVEVNETE